VHSCGYAVKGFPHTAQAGSELRRKGYPPKKAGCSEAPQGLCGQVGGMMGAEVSEAQLGAGYLSALAAGRSSRGSQGPSSPGVALTSKTCSRLDAGAPANHPGAIWCQVEAAAEHSGERLCMPRIAQLVLIGIGLNTSWRLTGILG